MEFDFFVDNEYFIEYDGEQHFHSISTWGGDEAFERNQTKDKMKNQICENRKIPIIRIPYWIAPEAIIVEDISPEDSQFLC